jgi:ribosome assembly protein 1
LLNVRHRLRRRLERHQTDEPDDRKVGHDFDIHVETGFQFATFQGPLCAEPVEGLAYFVEALDIDQDGVEKEIGMLDTKYGEKLL